MILIAKRDKEIFNYDTNSTKFYYCQNHFTVKGPTKWNWEFDIKRNNNTLLSPNCLGVWYE